MRDCRSQSASSSQWKHNWGFFLAIFFMNKYLLRLLPFHQIWGSRAVCGHRQSAPLQAFSRWSPASQHRCFAPWPTKTRSQQDLIAKKHNAAFPRNDAKHIQNRLGELPFSVTFYSTSLGRSPGSEAQAVASKHWEFNAGWGESYTQHTHRNLMQRQGKQQWRLLNAIFFFHLTTLIFYSWPFFPHLSQNYKQHLNQILHDRRFLQGLELPYFSTHFQKSCTRGVYLSGSHCTDLKINATELWGQQIWMYPISFNFKPWI